MATYISTIIELTADEPKEGEATPKIKLTNTGTCILMTVTDKESDVSAVILGLQDVREIHRQLGSLLDSKELRKTIRK